MDGGASRIRYVTVRAESSPRRRRRTPEAAQREIIDAAEALLKERPFRELTVDEVMRRTDLSRPSFYVYFRDRHELVLRLVQHVFSEMVVPVAPWLEDGSGAEELRDALLGVTELYAQYGHVLRALADAAADDPEVERAYNEFVGGFIDLAADRMQQEASIQGEEELDAREVATALVWMGERYLYLTYGSEDGDRIGRTLATVWLRTIYGAA